MTVVVISVAGITIVMLYLTALGQQQMRLIEIAQSRARLIEAIARFDQQYAVEAFPQGALAATLLQVREAQENFAGFGQTGEFVLAEHDRASDQIVFLLSKRSEMSVVPDPIPFSGKLAEPMRRALSGQSGTVIGLDYRGAIVLAAYEPVNIDPGIKLGIVAKIDFAEIQAPFADMGLLSGASALALIALGVVLFTRITNPLIRNIEESEIRYRALFEQAADAIVLIDPRNGEIVEFNDRAYEDLGYSREEFQHLKLSAIEISWAEAEIIQSLRQTLAGEYLAFETQHRRKDGQTLDIEVSRRVILVSGRHYVQSIWRDITGRKRVDAALKTSEERYRGIFDHSLNGIALHQIVVDAEGKPIDYIFLEANDAFEVHTGLKVDEIIGKRVTEVIPDIVDSPFIEVYGRVALTHTPVQFQQYAPPLRRHFEITAFSLYEGRFATIFADISERKAAEKHELELAVEREKTAMLQTFIGNVSHDLKTPLATINSSLYLLERYTDAGKRLEKIDNIKSQVRVLEGFIQNLLTLSHLDHLPQLNLEVVELNRLIQDVRQQLSAAAEIKRLSTVVELDTTIETIQANRAELGRALTNLLENAINYTPDGGAITLRTAKQDDAILVEVSDTGVGIGEADLPQIFQRFYRAESTRTMSSKGSGLGLAIVDKVAQMHGGRVEVESILGKGSTFRIRLPVSAPTAMA